VKDNDGEECDGDAGNDEVDGVKQRFSSNRDVERDIRPRFGAVVVALDVFARRHVEDVPLDALVEVLQVDSVVYHVARLAARFLVNMGQVDLQTCSGSPSLRQSVVDPGRGGSAGVGEPLPHSE